MNNISIIGRLPRDPESRNTPTGKTVAKFSLAVRKFKAASDGSDTDWFDVEAWGHDADYVTNYGTKGRLAAVCGRMESRKHEGKTYWTIKATSVSFLDRPTDSITAEAPTTNADAAIDPFA